MHIVLHSTHVYDLVPAPENMAKPTEEHFRSGKVQYGSDGKLRLRASVPTKAGVDDHTTIHGPHERELVDLFIFSRIYPDGRWRELFEIYMGVHSGPITRARAAVYSVAKFMRNFTAREHLTGIEVHDHGHHEEVFMTEAARYIADAGDAAKALLAHANSSGVLKAISAGAVVHPGAAAVAEHQGNVLAPEAHGAHTLQYAKDLVVGAEQVAAAAKTGTHSDPFFALLEAWRRDYLADDHDVHKLMSDFFGVPVTDTKEAA